MAIFSKMTPCGTCSQSIPSALVSLHSKACNSLDRRWRTAYSSCTLCGLNYKKAHWLLHEASETHQAKIQATAKRQTSDDRIVEQFYDKTYVGAILELPNTKIDRVVYGEAYVSMPRDTSKALSVLGQVAYNARQYALKGNKPQFARNDTPRFHAIVALYLAPYLQEHEKLPDWIEQIFWSQALGMTSGWQAYGGEELTDFFLDLPYDLPGFYAKQETFRLNAMRAIQDWELGESK